MALSNMGNEPRREWTEQGFGVLCIVLYLTLNYYLLALMGIPNHNPKDIPTAAQYLLGGVILNIGLALLLFVTIGLWYLAHEVGEEVCDIMSGMGFDPRPKNRPNGRR